MPFFFLCLPGLAAAQPVPPTPTSPTLTNPPPPDPPAKPPVPATSSSALATTPPASASAPVTAALGLPGVCAPGQQQKIEQLRASVVRVQSGGVHLYMFASSAGVLYGDSRHVLTKRSVIGVGRPLSVTLASGETMGARVVSSRSGSDLVLLELEQAAPAPPLALALEGGQVSAPVFVMELDPDWLMKVHPAHVSLRSASEILIDFPAQNWRGGLPLLDCEGRLVGLSTNAYDLRFDPAALILPLVDRPTIEETSALSFAHLSLLVLTQKDRDRNWVGVAAGGAMTWRDRLEFRLTVGRLGELPPQQNDPVSEQKRVQIESVVGYRILLVPEVLPTYLTPTVGLVSTWDWQSGQAATSRVRPTFGARIQAFPVLSFGYGFQPSLGHSIGSTHQFSAGIEF